MNGSCGNAAGDGGARRRLVWGAIWEAARAPASRGRVVATPNFAGRRGCCKTGSAPVRRQGCPACPLFLHNRHAGIGHDGSVPVAGERRRDEVQRAEPRCRLIRPNAGAAVVGRALRASLPPHVLLGPPSDARLRRTGQQLYGQPGNGPWERGNGSPNLRTPRLHETPFRGRGVPPRAACRSAQGPIRGHGFCHPEGPPPRRRRSKMNNPTCQ